MSEIKEDLKNKKRIKFRNRSLAEANPELAKEFDLEANYPLTPEIISCSNKDSVWWKKTYYCDRLKKWFEFTWQSSVSNRYYKKTECPYLTGHKVWVGFNDLTSYPEYKHLVDEWDYVANYPHRPEDFTLRSNYYSSWILEYYDSFTDKTFVFKWEDYIANRTKKDKPRNCPFLSGHKVYQGFNDLMTKQEQLMKEWCWEKNTDISPYEITEHSNKIAFWRCSKCNNIYPAKISSRTRKNNPTKCFECTKSKFQKFTENIFDINNIEITTEKPLFNKYKFDIYCENLKLLCETDGKQHLNRYDIFHNTEEDFLYQVKRDNDKNTFALEQGIPLLRVPYLDTKWIKNQKKIERWVLDFVDTRIVPQEIIDFYAEKNPESNYPEVARKLNEMQKQKGTAGVCSKNIYKTAPCICT